MAAPAPDLIITGYETHLGNYLEGREVDASVAELSRMVDALSVALLAPAYVAVLASVESVDRSLLAHFSPCWIEKIGADPRVLREEADMTARRVNDLYKYVNNLRIDPTKFPLVISHRRLFSVMIRAQSHPIIWEALRGTAEAVQALLRAKVYVHAAGDLALTVAVERNASDIVSTLIGPPGTYAPTLHSYLPALVSNWLCPASSNPFALEDRLLMQAVRYEETSTLKALLRCSWNKESIHRALDVAIEMKNAVAVEHLMAALPKTDDYYLSGLIKAINPTKADDSKAREPIVVYFLYIAARRLSEDRAKSLPILQEALQIALAGRHYDLAQKFIDTGALSRDSVLTKVSEMGITDFVPKPSTA